MIRQVRFEESTYSDLPYKFEAGTPNIAGVIGLGVAIDYILGIGLGAINDYERDLLQYASERASHQSGMHVVGTASDKAAILSFNLEGIHAHDVGTVLDHHGVAVRAGHHCAMPVMERLGISGTVRASFGMYNTTEEINRLFQAISKTQELLKK